MNCDTNKCFGDVVLHPLIQTGALPEKSECHVANGGGKTCGSFGLSEQQPFMRDPNESAYYRYIIAGHSGKVLDVPGASNDANTAVDQFANYQKDQERWLLELDVDGYYRIRVRHSGQCLDIRGASRDEGGRAIQSYCNGNGDSEKFELVSDGHGAFAISSKLSGLCLDVAGAGSADGAPVIQYHCTGGKNQKFKFRR